MGVLDVVVVVLVTGVKQSQLLSLQTLAGSLTIKSFRVLYHLWQRQINDEMNNNSNLSKIKVYILDSQHLL